MAYSRVAPLGAAQAIQEKGLQGQVALVGARRPNLRRKTSNNLISNEQAEADRLTVGGPLFNILV
ncbi:hypothetical protein [Paenibacillus phocaensis]|uniref:hypothetical protein n=1 Tax=Paenibacillus phocaensis TaxID=1776378 RepID=UPI0003A980A0|nr:hypothetical protein [Paenibacillus phocaensis]